MDNKALGKGLSALIPKGVSDNKDKGVSYLKTSNIKYNRLQPRFNYNDAKLNELVESIKNKGVLQPILVREAQGGYEVIAGERRLKAAQKLGLEEIPAIVKNVDDKEALVIALVENIQREELNAIEEAEAYRKLIDEFFYTHESIAQSVGKDRSTITNFIRLLKLPAGIRESLGQGVISVGHARTLLSVESKDEQKNLHDKILKKGLSVRELENIIKIKTSAGARRPKAEEPKRFEILALEEELQKVLGTKVRVAANKKRGKIIIDYYSLSDLERILKIFQK